MDVSMKTIELKLFKPSLFKRSIIDEALENYSRAYDYLMQSAYEEIEVIRENYMDSSGKYRAKNISKWINKEMSKELNRFNIEPFKDSIKIDFSSSIAGLLNSLTNDDNFKKTIYKTENQRPIFFCRYSKKRNYSLLYDSDKDKYYAKIYLMNTKNNKRKKTEKNYDRELKYISSDKEIYKEGKNKQCFIIFPLAFGKWQENYLKEAIENPGMIKTARLIKRKKEYFLSINIAINIEKPVELINYMGISRGNERAINYAVVDEKGTLLCEGHEEIQGIISIDKLNIIANSLVKIAKENSCQVVMERLTDKGDKLTYQDKQGKSYMPIISCSNYNKLSDIMKYKIRDNGLKNVIGVSGVSIFETCPFCKHRSKGNRFSNNILICTSCGMTIDVDKAGSLNLARKIIQYNNEKIKILIETTKSGVRFINTELGLEFYPANPFDCFEEFMKEIDKIIKSFYDDINLEKQKQGFKRKLSLIKKLEARRDIFQLIENN